MAEHSRKVSGWLQVDVADNKTHEYQLRTTGTDLLEYAEHYRRRAAQLLRDAECLQRAGEELLQ